jgi:hypothetical protein
MLSMIEPDIRIPVRDFSKSRRKICAMELSRHVSVLGRGLDHAPVPVGRLCRQILSMPVLKRKEPGQMRPGSFDDIAIGGVQSP